MGIPKYELNKRPLQVAADQEFDPNSTNAQSGVAVNTSINAALVALAPAWSQQAAYNPGDLVMRNGKIWRALHVIASGTSWAAADWEEVDLNDLVQTVSLAEEITYSELVTLRNGGNLVPGKWYRITDYACTTTQANTKSAGHPFDIIVRADDASHLNENGCAARHEGDEYFVDCKLEAWELKYCLDNDTNRFAWADDTVQMELTIPVINPGSSEPLDTVATLVSKDIRWKWKIAYNNAFVYTVPNPTTESELYGSNTGNMIAAGTITGIIYSGKGVIYYMKDEWGNECPYDFKNIMFKRWAVSEVTDQKMTKDALEALNEIFVFDGDETKFQARFGYQGNDCTYGSTVHVVDPNDTGWYYTFSVIVNDVESGEYSLNDIEDGSIKGNNYYNDEGGGGFYGNTIKPRYNNMASDEDGIDGAQVLNNIVLNGYYENSDENPYIYGCNNNSFGGNCYDNTFGNGCNNNSFGNGCNWNSFGSDCYWNSFGNGCNWNSFGNNCQSNSFGNYFQNNSFGNYFQNNSFGNYFQNNSFGNGCNWNSFGNNCGGNSFGNSCSRNTFGNNCQSNSFGNYFQNNSFGNNCGGNSFGNGCNWNSFGNDCYWNSFGNNCYYNTFGNGCNNNSFGNYCQTITVFDGVQNCSVTGGSQSAPVKNAQILNGTAGTSQNMLTINFAANKSYTQIAAKNTPGNLVIFNPADMV